MAVPAAGGGGRGRIGRDDPGRVHAGASGEHQPCTHRQSVYFTPESPVELTMMPASGILEPEVAGGNQFIVSFAIVDVRQDHRGQARHRDE